jgi:hypothetical protein
MKLLVKLLTLTLLAGCAVLSAAQEGNQDDVRNFGAIISGNQEQPKVLYIVPWKAAEGDAAIPYRPIRPQADNLFSHIERSEHVRHLEFLEELSQADTE